MIYDLLIIGGGIHGAACAQAAAANGYSALVLEQYDKPGLGTSSKSSKLIHGGLRYLESGQFKLVRECLQERRYLLRNAPELVELVPFYIPVYKNTRRRALLIRLGLLIYSLFSLTPFGTVSPAKWHQLDNLKTSNLKTVFQYFDARTNSRDTIIHHDNIAAPRIFSLYGGKLTAHRATAEQLISVIKPHLPRRKKQADTKKLKLPSAVEK